VTGKRVGEVKSGLKHTSRFVASFTMRSFDCALIFLESLRTEVLPQLPASVLVQPIFRLSERRFDL